MLAVNVFVTAQVFEEILKNQVVVESALDTSLTFLLETHRFRRQSRLVFSINNITYHAQELTDLTCKIHNCHYPLASTHFLSDF